MFSKRLNPVSARQKLNLLLLLIYLWHYDVAHRLKCFQFSGASLDVLYTHVTQVLSCQPRVLVTSYFVNKVKRDL